MKKKRVIIIASFVAVAILTIAGFFLFGKSFALNSGDKIDESSSLDYYLTVNYDGVDVTGKESNDTTVAEVKSDIIKVEDTIPEGLEFQGFVGTPGQQIDAVKRSDKTQGCSGYVVGGYEGLVYNAETRTVSFQVKDLQAGCELTVGIKTKTPLLEEKDRIDFFNTAYAQEKNQTSTSNTFHSYIGNDTTTKYKVTYKYTGTKPENAPTLPTEKEYPANSEVAIESILEIEGYSFSGFSCNTTVTNNKFTIESDVVCSGSFTKEEVEKYKVTYSIEGEKPTDYYIPEEESYKENDLVRVDDTVVKNSIVNGYKFLGWKEKKDKVVITNEEFTMISEDIELVGKFEKIEYIVTYAIQGDIPTGVVLPENKKYYPKEEVEVEEKVTAEGYEFEGWYSDDVEINNNKFEMIEKNITLYGKFVEQAGIFEPKITIEIENDKEKYSEGEVIKQKIIVENTANFEIKEVYLKQEKESLFQERTMK